MSRQALPDATGAAAMAAAIGCVYALQWLHPDAPWERLFALPSAFWDRGEWWRVFSYMWLHSTQSPAHILVNTAALWYFGRDLSSIWGAWRFVRFFVVCGVAGGLGVMLWPKLLALLGVASLAFETAVVGASGAIVGVLVVCVVTSELSPEVRRSAALALALATVLPFGAGDISSASHLGGGIGALALVRRDVAASLRALAPEAKRRARGLRRVRERERRGL